MEATLSRSSYSRIGLEWDGDALGMERRVSSLRL